MRLDASGSTDATALSEERFAETSDGLDPSVDRLGSGGDSDAEGRVPDPGLVSLNDARGVLGELLGCNELTASLCDRPWDLLGLSRFRNLERLPSGLELDPEESCSIIGGIWDGEEEEARGCELVPSSTLSRDEELSIDRISSSSFVL